MDPHFDPDLDQNWQEGSGPTLLICFPQCQGYQPATMVWSELCNQNHRKLLGLQVWRKAGCTLDFPTYVFFPMVLSRGYRMIYRGPLFLAASCLSFSVFLWKGERGRGRSYSTSKKSGPLKSIQYALWAENLIVLGRVAGRRYPRRRGRRPPAGGQRRGTGGRRRGWCTPTCPAGWRGGPPPLLSWLLVNKALPLRPVLFSNFTQGLAEKWIMSHGSLLQKGLNLRCLKV